MATPTRILFVSGEVAPFAKQSEVADLARKLPEQLQEIGAYESRIMMPRYGTISERKNRLHEVIRLSGTEVPVGEETETLKVKVASIPGIRLQVYFMDNTRYFKRKGVYQDKSGNVFEDNDARAMFFARAALETIRNLGWQPDVVHAFGWMSAPVPVLLRTSYAEEPLFKQAKIVYTPNDAGLDGAFTQAFVDTMGLEADSDLLGKTFEEAAPHYADAVLLPPNIESPTPSVADAPRLEGDDEAMARQTAALYESVLSSVPA